MTKLFSAKPFIIAEIGSNWTNFQEAKDSISFAKQCGADAVKFQLFDDMSLYGRMTVFDDSHRIPLDWFPKLKEKADACGIEFMCSAFSPELVDAVDPYVSVHKIASSDNNYPQLLERVKSKGKPILLSTGATGKADLKRSLDVLRGASLVLMYCSSSYPSTQYNLFYMQDLKETFNVPVGFSDHSLDVCYSSLSAFHHFQAVAIEKHVNFFENNKTPDSGHSLNSYDFRLMCEFLHGKRDYKSFNPMPEEHDMFVRHNRRLIALKDIQIGEKFKYAQNFGAYRALKDDSNGLSPFEWALLERSQGALRNVKAGHGIGPGDFL